jgi:hypothetical protein
MPDLHRLPKKGAPRPPRRGLNPEGGFQNHHRMDTPNSHMSLPPSVVAALVV